MVKNNNKKFHNIKYVRFSSGGVFSTENANRKPIGYFTVATCIFLSMYIILDSG